jgi:hypothetical protein
MDQNYKLSATDQDGNVIIAGEGPVLVLYYLAEKATAALEDLGVDVDATVNISHGDAKILAATIDAESAASLIKGRVLKLRRSLAPAETTPTVG